ncbi:hypothetical protein PYR73_18395 (plasmid) [Acinetobacter soli]|nr:hypothetical protein [Acinetobacter soli]WEH90750.1 hypothetical protein PX669_18670 [Acinetobacter soli]WEH90888.1 hypothetical protein PYR75_00765 [Acinetobacter soli]WEH99380.1 hypothetical protein PYR76_17925 [Acinetobacter soli]WEI11414.1 hypothetical protein PYR73_18395 [Acinetobacter soli]
MTNYSIPYHDVDILIPAQRFEVKFNYTSSQMPNFIDSMIMRLLRISPMSADSVANFLGLNQRESRIVLEQLITNNEIELKKDDLFHLTNKSMKYFTTVDSIPKVASILEHTQNLMYELTNFNFIPEKPDNNMYGLKLIASNSNAANSENIVRDRFQKQFYQLVEDEAITLKKWMVDQASIRWVRLRKSKTARYVNPLTLILMPMQNHKQLKLLTLL